MPDQIYGNSIEGKSLWADRKLPTPTSNDTFRGDGRPASNLYSGTEMMGALEGLEHLLAAQAKRAGSDPITTYISMTTDGLPERRAWWDTRKGPGSDSLTGQDVRLPDALGGDGTDADFPAIYADLFGERTFDPSKGGWAYDYFTSYALPDFVG